jgi:hypothetical protein
VRLEAPSARAERGGARTVMLVPRSAGMMSGAFFVGKKELLDWLNTTFNCGYSKVEQCASGERLCLRCEPVSACVPGGGLTARAGAAHCQILDSIYPGTGPRERLAVAVADLPLCPVLTLGLVARAGQVPLHKVNFNAKCTWRERDRRCCCAAKRRAACARLTMALHGAQSTMSSWRTSRSCRRCLTSTASSRCDYSAACLCPWACGAQHVPVDTLVKAKYMDNLVRVAAAVRRRCRQQA